MKRILPEIEKVLAVSAIISMFSCGEAAQDTPSSAVLEKPNIILVMADDLGYGDLGITGNRTVKTPSLDSLAQESIWLEQFYAAAPVCSPTRGSCLTGRHPFRYHIDWAGSNPVPMEEITVAELLKEQGYATGHFGKWHVGTLSKTVKQSYFPGPVDTADYSPPWLNGFDECFSTESMMPTYNPYYHVGGDYGTEDYKLLQDAEVSLGQQTGGFRWRDHYWTGPGQIVDEWLEGDDSKLIMDRALDFMERKKEENKNFLSVIWFHTPHSPIVAGPEDRAIYDSLSPEEQHWFGALSAMDRQVGRLMHALKQMDLDDNTIVWFCSDNGPSYIHDYNSTGGFRGKKATLFDGGIRVPGFIYNPLSEKGSISYRITTSDILPTVATWSGSKLDSGRLLDGADIHDEKNLSERSVCFRAPLPNRFKKDESSKEEQWAIYKGAYKLLQMGDTPLQLYDLAKDPFETQDLSESMPEKVSEMELEWKEWNKTVELSRKGNDYEN